MKSRKLTLLLSLISFSAISQSSLTGTWNSTFGELRLLQVGNTVVGDYANLGVIEATLENNTLKGRFTNKKNEGEFEWQVKGSSFTGKWWWMASPNKKGPWNGNLTTVDKPNLSNEDETGHTTEAAKGIRLGVNPRPIVGSNSGKPSTLDIIRNNPPKNNTNTNTSPEPVKTEPVKKPNYIAQSGPSARPQDQLVGGQGNSLEQKGNEAASGYVPSPDKVIACRKVQANYEAAYNQLFQIAPSAKIQPGVLLNYNQFESGVINPIYVQKREPLKITVKSGGTAAKSLEISNFNNSIVSEISSLFPQNPVAISTNYEVIEVSSLSEFKLALQMTNGQKGELIKSMKVDSKMKGGIDLESKKLKKYFLLKFRQVNYTAVVDNPPRINGLAYYTNEPLPEDALLVNEIGYGRMIYYLVEYTEDLFSNTMNFEYAKSVEGGKPGATKENSRSFALDISSKSENSKLKVVGFSVGDNGTFLAEGDDFSSLKRRIEDHINTTSGVAAVPLYYTLELARNNQAMKVKFIDKVEREECLINGGKFKLSIDAFFSFENNESGEDEIYGIGWGEVFINTKNGQKVNLTPIDKPYIGNYSGGGGRLLEIPHANPISVSEGNGFGFQGGSRTFFVDASKYGYSSLEEALKNTYYKVKFSAKEDDGRKDEIFSEVSSGDFNIWAKPFIDKRNSSVLSRMKISNEMDGILRIRQYGAHYAVSYSIEPLKN